MKDLLNKKLIKVLSVLFFLLVLTVTSAQSADYIITQLTDNSYNDSDLEINSNGWVTWVR